MHKNLQTVLPSILFNWNGGQARSLTGVVLFLLAVLSVAAGCQGLAGPNWSSPGTAAEQRLRAQRFDPFPENEASPPIDGARPHGFQTPPAEVKRSRWTPGNWGC